MTPGTPWCSATQNRWYPSASASRASATVSRSASPTGRPSRTRDRSRTEKRTPGKGPVPGEAAVAGEGAGGLTGPVTVLTSAATPRAGRAIPPGVTVTR